MLPSHVDLLPQTMVVCCDAAYKGASDEFIDANSQLAIAGAKMVRAAHGAGEGCTLHWHNGMVYHAVLLVWA